MLHDSAISKTISLLVLLSFAVLLSGQVAPVPADATSVATDDASIRVAYIFAEDRETGEQFRELLGPAGYSVSLEQLPFRVFLPVVLKMGQSPDRTTGVALAAREPGPLAVQGLDLTSYDLFVIAHDTVGRWGAHIELVMAIYESGKPVVALGQGGHEFLGRLELPNGAPNGYEDVADTLFATDRSQSRPFYRTPHDISLGDDDSVQVLVGPGPVIAVPLPEPLPEGIRVAGLTPEGPYPLVLAGERFLLWGFIDGPAAMTEAGHALFINALWFRASDLVLPIKGADFVPAAGFDEEFLAALYSGGEPLHALVQLDHVPDPAEREALAERGITLQAYLSGTFYAVLVAPTLDPDDPFLRGMIRWLGSITPDLKVDPEVLDAAAMRVASTDTLLVTFFEDVSQEMAAEILSQYTDFWYFIDHVWEAPYDPGVVEALSQEEGVRWIGAGPPPPLKGNDEARSRTGTNTVQNAIVPTTGAPTYVGLAGKGVVVAQFEDPGPEITHPDLTGRASKGAHSRPGSDDHATHVAGIMIGSGLDSINHGGTNRQWRGHAPVGSLVAEDRPTANSFSDAIRQLNAEVSNHSYLQTWGDYSATAVLVDRIVRGNATDSNSNAIPAHLAVWAAGNEGMRSQHTNEEGFYSITSPAKNSLSVGSIDSVDGQLSMFSSKGPTFDGRIKPDVVAPGARSWDATTTVYANTATGVRSTIRGSMYGRMAGTSMAAPATAGVIALMLEQYHYTFGSGNTPLPATLKAILVNTADDLQHTQSDASDDNDPDLCRSEGAGSTPFDWADNLDQDCWIPYGPGPDFATGYGAINAVKAVNAVRGKLFLEDSLSPTDTVDEFTFTIPAGRNELRFTLAWDDEPGDASLAVTANQLVNDLDLRLIGPDGTHFPFVLDPLPHINNLGGGGLDPIDQDDVDDARRADNDRDNVEQVLVNNPVAGQWRVRVTIEGNFPRNRAQSYALAGDFRRFNIEEPTTSNPADGGSKDDPATFLVILQASQPFATGAPDTQSTLVDSQASDFQVRINGTAATVVSGLPVGDQFWLMVRPQSGVHNPDKYDLGVTWQGYGTDTESDAVVILQRRTADRVIIVDHSGSMSDYDKMKAAKNAGRLFVDQALPDDRVAVVGFSTNASSAYPIKIVSTGNNPKELQDAKTAINNLNPTNLTAIGKALLQGKTEIDKTRPSGTSEIRRMVLLSDGMENVSPLYNTSQVKGVIKPTDIVVDTVAVGPKESGQHKLLKQIAKDNSGRDFHVTESGSGATVAGSVAAAPPSEWAWTSELENRLADQYKTSAEDVRREQRLWQVAGDISIEEERHDYDVYVEDGLASATFAVNWASSQASLQMELHSPRGHVYSPGDPDVIYRSDSTHETWIIADPEPGWWAVGILISEGSTEYIAWLSAHTRVTFQLIVATPPDRRVAGEPVNIIAVLDDGLPILGAEVLAQVRGPDDSTWMDELWLHDDGEHGDGLAGDGIYGNWYLKGLLPGNYGVHARAAGLSNLGEGFLRYADRTFHVLPRALYVHDGDTALAASFRSLLEAHGWAVEVSSVASVPRLDMTRYHLVIIGQETGDSDEWGTNEAYNAIMEASLPVLGLSEGGYAFFGENYVGLNIGYPFGAHGSGNQIDPNRPTESIWEYPYELSHLLPEPLTLYDDSVPVVSIFLDGQESSGIHVYGWDTPDPRYADLVREVGQYTLWGFANGPEEMTDTGRQLFVNTTFFTAFGGRP